MSVVLNRGDSKERDAREGAAFRLRSFGHPGTDVSGHARSPDEVRPEKSLGTHTTPGTARMAFAIESRMALVASAAFSSSAGRRKGLGAMVAVPSSR